LTPAWKAGKSIFQALPQPKFLVIMSPLSQNRERVSAQVQPFGSIELAQPSRF